jgi:hypothetical protein
MYFNDQSTSSNYNSNTSNNNNSDNCNNDNKNSNAWQQRPQGRTKASAGQQQSTTRRRPPLPVRPSTTARSHIVPRVRWAEQKIC